MMIWLVVIFGILIFLFAIFNIVVAIWNTTGRTNSALTTLLLISIFYVAYSSVANWIIYSGKSIHNSLWFFIPFTIILTSILWLPTVTDWQVLMKRIRIADTVETKIGALEADD